MTKDQIIAELDKLAQNLNIPTEYRVHLTFLADELRDKPIFDK